MKKIIEYLEKLIKEAEEAIAELPNPGYRVPEHIVTAEVAAAKTAVANEVKKLVEDAMNVPAPPVPPTPPAPTPTPVKPV